MAGVSIPRAAVRSAAAMVIVALGAGWSVRAVARQTTIRPFVPRPAEVRPLPANQASRQPPPLPGARSTTLQNPPAAAKSDDQKQKQASLDLQDPTVDERTGITTGRDFIYKVDDMTVTGAKARYNKNTKFLEADGNLILDDPKHHITGEKATYDNRKSVNLAIITGAVVIVLKPKEKAATPGSGDVAKEKDNGATIYCDRVEYFKTKDFSVLTGHLTFKQMITKSNGKSVERTLTADHAEYDGKAEKVRLFAPVDVKDTEDQTGHFEKDVFVGTKEGAESLQSSGRMTVHFNRDGDEADSAPDAKPGATGSEAGKTPSAPAPTPLSGQPNTSGKNNP